MLRTIKLKDVTNKTKSFILLDDDNDIDESYA